MDLIHSRCFDLFPCTLLLTTLFVISGATPERPHQSVDPCSPNPCQNRAICVRHNDGYMCYCVPGFQGSHCQFNVNECISQPCMNGATCEDRVGRFSCSCSPGFTGVTCEVDIDECQSQPCLSGGSCHDYPGGFNCTCAPGFQGQRCEINIDECREQPCQNGAVCIDGANEYSCDCSHTAFIGTHCEIPQPACHSEPCLNGAICTDEDGNYTCECWPGFEGLQCETDIDECSSSPCMNAGRCIQRSRRELYGTEPLLPERYDQQRAAGYICSCPPGTAGSLCQEVINQCDPSPCQNGGRCEGHVGSYTCHCLQQNNHGVLYGGVNCDVRLTGCEEHDKCGEHGSCSPHLVDDTHDFTCSCSAGHTGPLCQTSTSFSFQHGGYLRLYRFDITVSSNITLSFKTVLPRVLLFHRQTQDLLLVLELNEGHLQFTLRKQDSDGAEVLSQVLELPHNVTDGQWHSVEAVLKRSVLSLRILDQDQNCRSRTCHKAVAVEETPAVSEISLQTLFFGGMPQSSSQQSQVPAFIGCMQDINVDQELIVLVDWLFSHAVTPGCSHRDHCLSSPCRNGGQCVNLWQSYQCHCPRPYNGQDCEEEHATARFGHEDSTSYAAFTVSHDLGQNFSISFFLRTQHSGLLMVLANNSSQYLHMWLMDGRVTLQVNTSQVLRAEKTINDGKVHFVSVEVMDDRMMLVIEAEKQGEVEIRPIYVQEGDKVYVGGLNETRTTAVLGGYFKGCIQDLRINDVRLQFFGLDTAVRSFPLDVMEDINTGCPGDNVCSSNPCLNGGTCYSTWDAFSCVCPSSTSGRHCEEVQWCELSPCPPAAECSLLYKGYECYSNATFLHDSTVLSYRGNGHISKGLNNILLNLRTQKLNAAVLHAEKDPAFIMLSVQDGYFVMELKSPTSADTEERGEQPVSTVSLRSNKRVSDGEWHRIFVFMAAPWALTSQWTLVLDGEKEKSITSTGHGGNLDFLREGVDIFLGGLSSDAGRPLVGCLGTVELGGIALPYFSSADVSLPRLQKEQFLLTSRQPLLGCSGANVCEPNPCMNGGECHDYFNAYNCSCAEGWAGRRCESFLDSCESSPCVHGNCSAQGPTHECICESGYTGVDCEKKVDVCENHLCAHGATCLHGPDTYACLCPENYTGPFCNERTEEIPWYIVVRKVRPKLPVSVCGDDTRNYTCFNGGNCTERELSCDCPPGFTGHRCEQEVDECKSNPCLNGGYCRNLINKFVCVCEMSFAGEFCQTDVSDIYFYVALLLWQNLFQLLSYLILRLDDEPEVDWGGGD